MSATRVNMGGKGGNVTLRPGKGADATPDADAGYDGAIIFENADGTQAIRLDPDGKIFVGRELVDNDMAAWLALRKWIYHATGTVFTELEVSA